MRNKSVFVRVRDDAYFINAVCMKDRKDFTLELKRNEVYRASQPEKYDCFQFNTVINIGRKKYRVPSIDFDFYSSRKEAEQSIREESRQ